MNTRPLAAAALLAVLAAGTSVSATEPHAIAAPTPEDVDAPPIAFDLPIDCEPGIDCWVFKYVDLDPGPGTADFGCGSMTHDGHKGTDIALAHFARIRDGVAVRAAADGIVRAIRDEMPDIPQGRPDSPDVAQRQCGNAVIIDHAAGWTSTYCHLHRGSVRVTPGQTVRSGTHIGDVGLSGYTNFPHLHFGVLYQNRVVDPFTGVSGARSCTIGRAPLWQRHVLDRLPYRSAIIHNVGFSDTIPDAAAIRSGELTQTLFAPGADSLAFWIEIAGLRKNDLISMRLTDPSGQPVALRSERAKDDQPRIWLAVGVQVSDGTLRSGAYRGEVTVTREDRAGQARSQRVVFMRIAYP